MKDQEGNVKQWEAGRARLVEEQNMKRENEQTHRAALYVSVHKQLVGVDKYRSLPGLLENTPLLRVRALSLATCQKLTSTRLRSANKKSSLNTMPRYIEPAKRWWTRRPRR